MSSFTPPPPPPEGGSPYPRGPEYGGNHYTGMDWLKTYPPGVYFDFLSQAFNLVTKNVGPMMLTSLVFVLILLAVIGPFYALIFATAFSSALAQPPTGATPTPAQLEAQNATVFQMIGTIYGGGAIMQLLVVVVTAVLTPGFYAVVYDLMEGKRWEINRLFIGFKHFLPLAGSGILVYLITILGYIACCVPGIFITGATMFVAPFVYGNRVGAIEGIRMAWETCKPHAWMLFLLYIVTIIIAQIGTIGCYVGALFTIPIAVACLAMNYRVIFRENAGTF
jgi:uncharacterized membrane protein